MKKFGKRGIALLGCLVLMLAMAVPAFAMGSGESSIQTAVTGALSTVQTDATSMIAAVLPYALAIMGLIVVVTVGLRSFKKASK